MTRNIIPWQKWELDALTEVWPKGAMKSAREALPHRSENSIRGKAEYLGIKQEGRAKYKKQPSSEWIDAALRRAYRSSAPRLATLAKELDRTEGWLKWRAGILGIRHIADKNNRKWENEEQKILEECIERGTKISTIHRNLRQAGYYRSLTAISARIYDQKLGVNRKGWTANEVAGLFGIEMKSIINWIKKGWLSASREVGPSCDKWPDEIEERRKMYMITADNLKKFMLDYPRAWDHRRMRIEVLLDLLCGNRNGLLFSEKTYES